MHMQLTNICMLFLQVKMLALLHKANERLKFAEPEEFYNDAVNQLVNMKEDYGRWKCQSDRVLFSTKTPKTTA